MTESKKNALLVASISIVVLLIGFALFEIKDVPDAKWKKAYDYNDQEPNGLYVFKECMRRYFGVDNKVSNIYSDTMSNQGLYISFHEGVHSDGDIDTLINLAYKGNDILLVSKYFPEYMNEITDQYTEVKYQYDDKLKFAFTTKDSIDIRNYQYQFYNQEFERKDSLAYYIIGLDSLSNKDMVLVKANGNSALMIKYPFGDGNIYCHLMPELFINASYRQEGLFQYSENIFSIFDPAFIVFLINVNGVVRNEHEHPLQYVMSSPSLKWAYYLLVIGLLIYAIFGGRRRQKAIPIIDKNENTSLEYIKTISQLFYQQDKHEKLVAHMRDIFYYKMEKKFFVKRNHPTYLETLAKKTKIPASELSYVLDRFKNTEDNYTFQADQLIALHNRIEAIYKLVNKPKNNTK